MEIAATQQDGITVVTVSGSLDALTSEEATRQLVGQVREGRVNLVVDLAGVGYISSAGLRAILATMQEARHAGGDLRLAGAGTPVKKVLDMAGFTKIMKCYDDRADAVASFAP